MLVYQHLGMDVVRYLKRKINKYLSKPVIEVDTNVYDDAIIIGIL
jgi:hypothetical protein